MNLDEIVKRFFSLLLVPSFIMVLMVNCKPEIKINSLYEGRLGEENNIILSLNSEGENKLVGIYYAYCDSNNKTFLFGEIDAENTFVLKEKGNNLNGDIEIKGKIVDSGALIAERTDLKTGKKDQLLFSKINSKILLKIKCTPKEDPISRPTHIKDSTNKDLYPYKQQILTIKGRSLEGFKQKLESQSAAFMRKGGYSISNVSFNPNNLTFSCMLTPDPTSSFLKIGLYFGPVVNGYCESCTNVLNKNPGSQSLNSSQDNNYIYEIIAVSK